MNEWHRNQEGSIALEFAVIVPAVLAVLILLVAQGRTVNARANVRESARTAARTAALERNLASASAAAQKSVEATLKDDSIDCEPLEVRTSGDWRPGGSVVTNVSCTIDLADLGGPLLPGNVMIKARFEEVLDRYRGAQA